GRQIPSDRGIRCRACFQRLGQEGPDRPRNSISRVRVLRGAVRGIQKIMKSLFKSGALESDAPEGAQHPTFRAAFLFWLKLGFISFGGPTGQIAVMHTELVEKKKWISEARFLHALNYCMLLPGPEAQQLATYVGWLLHKTWGGIVAGAFFDLFRPRSFSINHYQCCPHWIFRRQVE